MQIALNKKTVIDADKTGNMITETGKYKGKIIHALPIVSEGKRTKGIEIGFRADDGSEAAYLRLWIESASGETIFGMGILQGIMAAMKVKGISQAVGKFEQYDKDAKQAVIKQGECYPELQNKPIGLLLQKVHYTKKDLTEGSKLEIICGFDYQTEQTGAEIMEGKPAESLAKRIATLTDRWEKPKQSRPVDDYYSMAGGNLPAGGDPFNDDIPFNCYEKNLY